MPSSLGFMKVINLASPRYHIMRQLLRHPFTPSRPFPFPTASDVAIYSSMVATLATVPFRAQNGGMTENQKRNKNSGSGGLLRGSATCCVSMPKSRGRGWNENYLLCHQRPYPSKTKRSSAEPTKSNYSYSIFNNQRQPTLPRELSPRLMTSRPGFSRL